MKNTGSYPRVHSDRAGVAAVGQAGGLLLVEAVRATGLDRALSTELAGWRKPLAVHDPGKILCDLALTLALGGDCLADLAQLRDEPGLYGRVASDPTVSRLIRLLARDAKRAVAAIGRARKTAPADRLGTCRGRVAGPAGEGGGSVGGRLGRDAGQRPQ